MIFFFFAFLLDKRPRCPRCNKTFTRSEVLKRHIECVHEGAGRCDMPGCGRVFATKSMLRKHKEKVHASDNIPDEGKSVVTSSDESRS